MEILTEVALARMLKLRRMMLHHALAPLMLKWGVTDGHLGGANERIGAYQHADSWRGELAHQMALAVGCRMYWATEDEKAKADAQSSENQERIKAGKPPKRFKWPQVRRIGFIGDTATVAALVRHFQAVESWIEAACAASYASLEDAERPVAAAAKKWKNNFHHGAVAAIITRILGAVGKSEGAKGWNVDTPTPGWRHGWQAGSTINIEEE